MIRALAALFLSAGLVQAEVSLEAILGARPPRDLAGFGFFEDAAAQAPSAGVTPYEITAPLFTDYAEKQRYVYTPEPVQAGEGVLQLPVGAALIKTFHYGDRKVETRVLVHKESGWVGYPYVWNAAGTEAKLKLAGANVALETEHGPIDYRVPNFNQCSGCHVNAQGAVTPIGPKPRNLAIGGQLERLVAAGVLSDAPDVTPTPDYRDASLPLDRRARSYLEANCAHCHAPGLPADTSGLYLNLEETRPLHLGIGKTPVAAGRGAGGLFVSIAPGAPEKSIMMYRMKSVDPGVMMPELGRSLIHAEGVQLIEDYIRAMK